VRPDLALAARLSRSGAAAALAGLLALAGFLLRNLRWRRLRAVGRITASAFRGYYASDGDAMAGYVAFSTFLAIFPFAIFATALAARFVDPAQAQAIVDALFDLAPGHVAQTLEPVVLSVTQGQGDRLVTISGLGALWVASNAVESIRVGFDRAYRAQAPRHFVWRRVIAIGFVVISTLIFGLLGFLVIGAPLALLIAEQSLGITVPMGLGLVRFGLGVAMLGVFLFQMHLILPTRRPPRRRLWPGVGVSVLLMILGAWGFSQYLVLAPSYSITYGALAGVIVTLLFLYLTSAAILFGAQVNAVLMTFRQPRPADDSP
jgi:membrane protein